MTNEEVFDGLVSELGATTNIVDESLEDIKLKRFIRTLLAQLGEPVDDLLSRSMVQLERQCLFLVANRSQRHDGKKKGPMRASIPLVTWLVARRVKISSQCVQGDVQSRKMKKWPDCSTVGFVGLDQPFKS